MSPHCGRLLACVAALLATLSVPSLATARPGALDRGFNGDGKVVTIFPEPERVRSYPNYAVPFEFAPGHVAMATGPGGKLVAANSQAIVSFLGDGGRDRRFGGGGAVPIDRIEGFRFQLADVAVDSKGRVLVAGTTKATNGIGLEGQQLAGPIPSIGTIRRYNPGGGLDRSFGADGVIDTYFGAPPATFEGNAYEEPAISLVGLAVDAQDRPLVAGSSVAEVGRCPSDARYETSRAFVARLAVSGAPDPSFAGGATLGIRELSWLGFPTAARKGFFAIGAGADPCRNGGPDEPSVVAGFGDGGVNPAFAGDGFWSRRFTRVSDLAAAPGGEIVLLTRTIELSRGKWVESAGTAIRLRRNGTLDRDFGDRGEAAVRLPRRGALAALATDRSGRVLLAGTIKRKPRRAKRPHLEFLLIRTTAAGQADLGFGRRGRTATGFGTRANVRATEVLVDGAGRIAVGGKLANPKSDNGFAIARYLGR